MLYKARTKSTELLILQSLNTRMELLTKDKQRYLNLKKGYEGEVMFDSLTENLQCDCLIINDLLLKLNHTTFQIDSLILTSETIHIFEIKNFEGDYFYEKDCLYTKNKSEINNPFIQLRRSESLFRQLLHSLGYNLSIAPLVVFINPEFTLYQAPLNMPFIFPSQINRLLSKFNIISKKLNDIHNKLADKLISLQAEDHPYAQLPTYNYDELRKGMICSSCNSFFLSLEGGIVICKDCGHKEKVSTAVVRSIEEYKLLFPQRKVTTNAIVDWCNIFISKKRIQRILNENYKIIGVHQWSHYI